MATAVGGTHPTGMHSCVISILIKGSPPIMIQVTWPVHKYGTG